MGFENVFFTMCGSTSVDNALKISLAYHVHEWEREQSVDSWGGERGCHGVGFGGLSVGGMPNNRLAYASCVIPGRQSPGVNILFKTVTRTRAANRNGVDTSQRN